MSDKANSIALPVQYVDDLDPFNVLANIRNAEPNKPKNFSFIRNIPLADQMEDLKKLLRAPHKVWKCSLVPTTP